MNDEKIINSIKGLSIDMINNANSGHPGIALGAAPILYTLYKEHLNINLEDDKWFNRDRFIMSAGHGSALLYSILYYVGYLTLDDLKRFRSIDSVTPGHPEYGITKGVEMTTGPLGQGIASAVGMAMAQKYYEKTVSQEINYNTYVLCGDGDLMEGVSYEALSLAGNLKLNKLIVLYDSNNISLDGTTNLTFNDDIKKRFESIGWNYLCVEDGSSVTDINSKLNLAKKSKYPTIIEVKTIIGRGSMNENTNIVHGAPLSSEDISKLKHKLNLNSEPFAIEENSILEFQKHIKNRCEDKYNNWISKNIDEKLKFESINLADIVSPFYDDMNEPMRITNGKIMNIISSNLANFIGGAADVSSSTKTSLIGKGTFSRENYAGKNIYYGVREHAMGAITNGLALCGLKPFASTFLAFSDYMKPALRIGSLMQLPVTYVFTHDSVTIGNDGPTHQPIEQLSMLRSIPGFRVFRPADANEILGCWNTILQKPMPSAIVLSRNASPLLKESSVQNVSNGAYIVKKEKGRLNAIVIATGTEVNLAINIANELEKDKINLRVVSMPCMSLFEQMNDDYKESLLPAGYKKIVIEFGCSKDWYKYVYGEKYLITLDEFGKSGSKEDVLKSLCLDKESIKKRIKDALK